MIDRNDAFIFDGIPSEMYGLYAGFVDSDNSNSASSGCSIETIKQKLKRKPQYHLQGVEYKDPLSFQLKIIGNGYIPRDEVSKIQRWLFGHHKYKKLQFVQSDLQDTYYNCILIEPEIISLNGAVIGFECKVECDAPWGWANNSIIKLENLTGTNAVTLINSSEDNGYTFPVLRFKVLSDGNVSFKNVTDNNRELTFTGLHENDEIVIDNDLQIITNEAGTGAFSKCNYKWFRLLPDENNLIITGDFENLEIEYKVARKTGAVVV